MSAIHTPTVRPGLNPGGLWVRIVTAHEVLTEHALNDWYADLLAVSDGLLVPEHAGERVWCYVYDGDDGHCWATIVAGP